MGNRAIYYRVIEDPLGLRPDKLELTGETSGKGHPLSSEDVRVIEGLINRRDVLYRIELLRNHTDMIPIADELEAMAIERGAGISDIEGDWELRARVAEAELTAMYLAAEGLPARVRVKNARAGAAAKLAKDKKQIAKSNAYLLWKDRYAGNCPSLRTNEQFAMECMRRWPELTSLKVICGWCTEWAKVEKSKRAS